MNDWIKIRPTLLNSPKLNRAALELGLDNTEKGFLEWAIGGEHLASPSISDMALRYVTLGAVTALWGVAREFGIEDGEDMIIPNLSGTGIDLLIGVPGIGEAMMAVGWIEETEKGTVFPNFFEHNARRPSDNPDAVRQREWRERKKERDIPVTNTVTKTVTDCDKPLLEKSRVEKSREEKSVSKESTLSLVQAESIYAAYPLKKGKKAAIKAILKALKEKTSEELMAGVQRYVKEVAGSEFIKHPATWFNQGCWDDESTPKNNGKAEGANVDTGRFYAKEDKYDGYEK